MGKKNGGYDNIHHWKRMLTKVKERKYFLHSKRNDLINIWKFVNRLNWSLQNDDVHQLFLLCLLGTRCLVFFCRRSYRYYDLTLKMYDVFSIIFWKSGEKYRLWNGTGQCFLKLKHEIRFYMLPFDHYVIGIFKFLLFSLPNLFLYNYMKSFAREDPKTTIMLIMRAGISSNLRRTLTSVCTVDSFIDGVSVCF